MYKPCLLSILATCFLTVIPSSTYAVIEPLEPRLVGLAYYDPNLNITWATDANMNGLMDWNTAKSWVAGLTIGGISGWRLPNMDVNGDGTVVSCLGGGVTGCNDNEMGFFYWEEGITANQPDPFISVSFFPYWSETEVAGNPTDEAWFFDFEVGEQLPFEKFEALAAWAVHDGDVGLIPILPSFWLFGSGLLGLVGIARRRKAA